MKEISELTSWMAWLQSLELEYCLVHIPKIGSKRLLKTVPSLGVCHLWYQQNYSRHSRQQQLTTFCLWFLFHEGGFCPPSCLGSWRPPSGWLCGGVALTCPWKRPWLGWKIWVDLQNPETVETYLELLTSHWHCLENSLVWFYSLTFVGSWKKKCKCHHSRPTWIISWLCWSVLATIHTSKDSRLHW